MFPMRSYKQRFMRSIRRVSRSSLKLSIELVPEPCFYSNLRNQIRPSEWDTIRRLVYARYNHQCGICGAKKKTLHCHEIWHYDDRTHIQRLEGFIALCPLCHHVKHIGYARLLAEEGKLNLKQVIDHFCRVNDCSYQMFKAHEEQELKRCTERNRHRWRTDLGEYASLIQPAAPMTREKLQEADEAAQSDRQEDALLKERQEEMRADRRKQWRQQSLLKIAPTKEQQAELEEEFYLQLEKLGYVRVSNDAEEQKPL